MAKFFDFAALRRGRGSFSLVYLMTRRPCAAAEILVITVRDTVIASVTASVYAGSETSLELGYAHEERIVGIITTVVTKLGDDNK